jgi:hypothetical protein
VLSRASIGAEWPMRELHLLLQRHHDRTVKLVPLLHFDDFDEFERCIEEYEGCRCCHDSCRCHKRLWAADLRKLQKVTMIRKDKVCSFGDMSATRTVPTWHSPTHMAAPCR